LSRLPVTLSTIQALIVANEFLQRQIAEMEAATSPGYGGAGSICPPRERKDWFVSLPS
jgi:hypothetical protein